MAVNLSPRLCRVTITNPDGSNPFDVTDLLIALETKDQPLDFSGWVMTSGTLELSVEVPGFNAKKLDPYETPEQWSRGMRVFVEVRKSNGNYVTHPRGELYILRRPAPPTEVADVSGRVLRIDVGCEASLKDYRQPAEDVSEIKLGQNTDPSTIINRLANRAKFSGNLIDTINDHPLNYPVFDLDGNFVSLMGALAWANGRLLYMLNDGQIKSQVINLEPDTADFKYRVGRDEQIFDPLPGSERPVEKVKVTSTTQVLDDSDPECEYTNGYEPRSYSETCYFAWKTNKPRTEQLEKIERGVLFPNWYPDKTDLITKIKSSSVDFYEPFGDEQLIKKVETVWEPVGVLFPDLIEEEIEGFPKVIVRDSRWSLTTMVRSSETTTLYNYKDDVVEEIETTVRRPKGILYPTFAAERGSVTESQVIIVRGGIETVTTLLRQQFTRQSWHKKSGRWFQKTETRQYGENTKNTAPSAGSSGTSTQPPATERKNNDWAEETKNLEAEVKFKAGPGSDFDERVREFQIKPGTATSDEQLEKIGLRIGKILQGRDFGWSFGVELSDEWLDRSYTPLVVMDWRKGNTRKRYLANGLVFVTTKEEALVGGELIEAGRTKLFAGKGNEHDIPIGEEITFNFDPVTGLNEVGLTEAQVEDLYDSYSNGTLVADYTPMVVPSFTTSANLSSTVQIFFNGSMQPGSISSPVEIEDEITIEVSIDGTSKIVVPASTLTGEYDGVSTAASISTAPSSEYPLPSIPLVLWHDAGLGVTGTNPVTNWADQSGNGRSIAYTSNVSVSPITYNSNPALRYNGINPSSIPPSTPSSNAWTIIVVCTVEVDSNWATGATLSRQIRVKRSGSQVMSFFNGATDNTSSTLPSNTSNLNIYSWVYDSANLSLKMYQNGTLVFNGSVATASIEWGGMERSSAARPNGDLAERMFWNGIITTAEHNAMGSAIATKYGLTWTTIASSGYPLPSASTLTGDYDGVSTAASSGYPLRSASTLTGDYDGVSTAASNGYPLRSASTLTGDYDGVSTAASSGYPLPSIIHPDTADLRDRIIAAGSTISASHLSAVNDFVEGCYTDGTRSAIKDCGLFVGDNLTGSLQKLWYINTSTLTNFGFVEGDYTLTGGLSSVGANKYLLTEESTSSLSIPSTSSHLSFFSIAGNPVGTFRDIGVQDLDNFQLIISFNGASYYRSHLAGSAIEEISSPGTIGYFIGSTGPTGSYIHRNGSQYASNANTGSGTITTNSISVFCVLNNYSQKASTGYTIGNHLTSAQAILLNNRFQTLKTALGR